MKNALKTAGAIGAAAMVLFLSACNTVEGAGQDIEAAGDKIEETADANKPE
ncbi:entericidin A/B family lipoprotein [Hyphomonas sp.]|uniref:entericidin A/B family lipoprotein n=1 Tax=Hyphomonas sp. TaxID=87 RepID=UPI0030FA5674